MTPSKAAGKTSTGGKGGKKKEKLHTMLAAASALTSLGDEDESGNESNVEGTAKDAGAGTTGNAAPSLDKGTTESKRYIPEHKKPDAALTFPEKLMSMMQFADKQPKGFCVAWIDDGKSFIIHDPDTFTRRVIPQFFKPTKFSSFTRKLYRWGFRQVNRGIGPDDPVIFGNEFFHRDQADLMAKMRSTTASRGKKKEGMDPAAFPGTDQNRYLLDQMYQEKTMPGQFMAPALQYPMRPGMMPMYMPYTMPPGGMPYMSPPPPHQGMSPAQPQSTPSDQKGQQRSEQPPGSAASSGQQNSPADIVNAAINALRYAA